MSVTGKCELLHSKAGKRYFLPPKPMALDRHRTDTWEFALSPLSSGKTKLRACLVCIRYDIAAIIENGNGILTVSLAITAVHGPEIVAMVVHRSMAVEKQSVLAVFEGQGAVRAEEEGVAALGMGVRVHPVWIGARRRVQKGS